MLKTIRQAAPPRTASPTTMMTTPSTTVPILVPEDDPEAGAGLEAGVGEGGIESAGGIEFCGGTKAGGTEPCGIDPAGIDPGAGNEFAGGIDPGGGNELAGGIDMPGGMDPPGPPIGGLFMPELSTPTNSTPQPGQCVPTGAIGPRLTSRPQRLQIQTVSVICGGCMIGGCMIGMELAGGMEPPGGR